MMGSLFDTRGFPPRWFCGRWSDGLGWLHICSDLAIFAAYMAIPMALFFFIGRRRDLPKPFPMVFWLFIGFILACGTTHLVEAIIFWHPIYRFAGTLKLATAGVSWATFAFLVPAIPRALALKSPTQLQRDVEAATISLRRERDYAAHLVRIVECSADAIVSQDMQGRVVSWNPAAESLFARPAAQALGEPFAQLVPELAASSTELALSRARSGEVVRDLETELNRGGIATPLSITISPVLNQEGAVSGLVILVRDISQARRADALFRAAVNAAPNGMIAVDRSGKIVLVNSEAERLFGYAPSALLGHSIDVLVPDPDRGAHAARRDEYGAAPEARRMGGGREVQAIRRDGTRFPVEVGLNPIEVDGEPLVLSAIVDCTEVRREQDAVKAKTAELVRSNEELEQFAYVASHDLQEPLRMVVNFMGLLERDYGSSLDAKAQRYVRFAADGAHRMKELIDAVLTYSRVDRRGAAFQQVSLRVCLDAVLATLSLRIRESGARIEVGELPVVLGDRPQLEMLFQNLLANAIKFRRDVPPEISVRCEVTADDWLVTVRDNGIGLEAEHAERIFQMFQRLNERASHPGSGIGLAVAKRIVSRHGGKIWARGLEVGTMVQFTLPRPAVAPEEAPA